MKRETAEREEEHRERRPRPRRRHRRRHRLPGSRPAEGGHRRRQ